jgi:hypothetical protein
MTTSPQLLNAWCLLCPIFSIWRKDAKMIKSHKSELGPIAISKFMLDFPHAAVGSRRRIYLYLHLRASNFDPNGLGGGGGRKRQLIHEDATFTRVEDVDSDGKLEDRRRCPHDFQCKQRDTRAQFTVWGSSTRESGPIYKRHAGCIIHISVRCRVER